MIMCSVTKAVCFYLLYVTIKWALKRKVRKGRLLYCHKVMRVAALVCASEALVVLTREDESLIHAAEVSEMVDT